MLGAWKQPQPHKPFVDDFTGGRRGSPRCDADLNVRVRFTRTLHGQNHSINNSSQPELGGETRNLSETGLAISLASNHIGGRYFNVIGCMLEISLELPDGPVHILTTPAWCKWLVEEEKVKSYLLGLKIVEMSDEEWVRLVRYVHACL